MSSSIQQHQEAVVVGGTGYPDGGGLLDRCQQSWTQIHRRTSFGQARLLQTAQQIRPVSVLGWGFTLLVLLPHLLNEALAFEFFGGPDFLINTGTEGSQRSHSISSLSGGGFVVTWYGVPQGGASQQSTGLVTTTAPGVATTSPPVALAATTASMGKVALAPRSAPAPNVLIVILAVAAAVSTALLSCGCALSVVLRATRSRRQRAVKRDRELSRSPRGQYGQYGQAAAARRRHRHYDAPSQAPRAPYDAPPQQRQGHYVEDMNEMRRRIGSAYAAGQTPPPSNYDEPPRRLGDRQPEQAY